MTGDLYSYLADMASRFAKCELAHLPVPESLRGLNLNFSLPSLEVLDAYLIRLHETLPRTPSGSRNPRGLGQEDAAALIVGAGAYVGEVLRKAPTGQGFEWWRHEDLREKYPKYGEIFGFEPTLLTQVALHKPGGKIWLPLQRIYKCLEHGGEYVTAYFARAVLE